MRRASKILFTCLCSSAFPCTVRADELGTTFRASEASPSVDANEASFAASVSGDGRFIAFASRASDLVPGDLNAHTDVFVYEVATRSIVLVSRALDGQPGDGDSNEPSLSFDGRYVAFSSRAANLIAGDTNGFADVFVRDRVTETNERVSLNAFLGEPDDRSTSPKISGDGRYVAFVSWGTNMAALDVNGQPDVFVYDRVIQRTARASIGFSGEGTSLFPSISADGRFIAFQSTGVAWSGLDTNGQPDIFVHDLVGSSTVRLSNVGGNAANGASVAASISGDGTSVVFESRATDLVAGDTNGRSDIFACEVATGHITRVNLGVGGSEAELDSAKPAASYDGRWIVFESLSMQLVASDQNQVLDVYLVDRVSGAMRLLSRSSTGVLADGLCRGAALSHDASLVAFESDATTLVGSDQNQRRDVYAHRPFVMITTSYCAGDGTAFACPCGNVGSAGSGCENTVGAGGARLEAMGLASVSADSFLLLGAGMPNGSPCLYYQGLLPVNGGNGAPFGDGLRCVTGSVVRLGVETNSGGSSSYGATAGDIPISVRGLLGATGGTRDYQIWYRDSPVFCTSAPFNLSNAVSAQWSP